MVCFTYVKVRQASWRYQPTSWAVSSGSSSSRVIRAGLGVSLSLVSCSMLPNIESWPFTPAMHESQSILVPKSSTHRNQSEHDANLSASWQNAQSAQCLANSPFHHSWAFPPWHLAEGCLGMDMDGPALQRLASSLLVQEATFFSTSTRIPRSRSNCSIGSFFLPIRLTSPEHAQVAHPRHILIAQAGSSL